MQQIVKIVIDFETKTAFYLFQRQERRNKHSTNYIAMKNPEETVSLAIPFSGFYQSMHSESVDSEIDSMFEAGDWGENKIPDEWHRHCDYGAIYNAYAEAYAEWFAEKLKKESGIDFELKFESLESPREYNFKTDKIYCTMPASNARKLVKELVSNSALAEVLIARHTSRDGFASFYSNDIEEWLELDFEELDEVHFESYLFAYLREVGLLDEFFNLESAFEFYEDFSGNGTLGNIICSEAGEECLALINASYEERSN